MTRIGNSLQALIRVYSDRFSDLLQQRQVIDGIAVKPGFGQVYRLAAEPFVEAGYLALLKRGGADKITGIAIVDKLRVGGNDVIDSQALCDRASHKAIGGSDNQ